VSKRSPILGFNHNVRYRGLVFHVQTEDSGVVTPHLFTHLFHHGVIVSTRKLVYDAGSAEESIKSLMQAQHKATLKDLRRGHFDDKIDSYLGGTPGLLPRGTTEDAGDRTFEDRPGADRPGEIELAPSQGTPSLGAVEEPAISAPTEQVLPMVFDDSSDTVMIVEKTPPPGRPPIPPVPHRTSTERLLPPVVPPVAARTAPAAVDTTLKTAAPRFDLSAEADFDPDIDIQLEEDEDGVDGADGADGADGDEGGGIGEGARERNDAVRLPRRANRDTETQVPFTEFTRPTLDVRLDDHTRPTVGAINEQARRATAVSDGIPGAIRPSSPALPLPSDSRRLGERPSTINAATLPPARPIARPPPRPSLSQPQIVSRPVTSDDRVRREPEAVEVYSPAPPSAELPPGERPGQYAQYKKVNTRIPTEGIKNERSGSVPIPAGLGRPQRSGPLPTPVKPVPAAQVPVAVVTPVAVPAVVAAPAAVAAVTPVAVAVSTPAAVTAPMPASRDSSSQIDDHAEPVRARAPTPARISPPSSTPNRAAATPNSGVVMTRPALIVGAPGKPVATTVPRIRRAREEESRGFGQGLISEKSLDEVILAYLSEDADEK
jgi:hypothetical protein